MAQEQVFYANEQDDVKESVVQPETSSVGLPVDQKGTSGQRSGSQQGSGRFLNIQDYLQANVGQQAGMRYSGQIQEDVQQKTKAGVSESGQKFKSLREGIDAGRTGIDNINKMQQKIGGEGFADEAVDFVGSDDFENYQAMIRGDAIDQQGIADQISAATASTQSAMSQAQDFANLTGSEAGRFQLLRNAVGGPSRYTSGQQRLDELFLQTSPDNQLGQLQRNIGKQVSELEDQQQSIRGFGEELYGTDDISGLIQQEQDLIGGLRELTTNVLTSEQERITSPERVAELQAQNIATRNRILENAKQGVVTPEMESLLGISKGRTFNLLKDIAESPEKYLQYAPDVTPDQLIGQSEAERLNALAQIAGSQQVFSPSEVSPAVSKQQNVDDLIKERQQDVVDYLVGQVDKGNALNKSVLAAQQMVDHARKLYNYYEGQLTPSQREAYRAGRIYYGNENLRNRLGYADADLKYQLSKYNKALNAADTFNQNIGQQLKESGVSKIIDKFRQPDEIDILLDVVQGRTPVEYLQQDPDTGQYFINDPYRKMT